MISFRLLAWAASLPLAIKASQMFDAGALSPDSGLMSDANMTTPVAPKVHYLNKRVTTYCTGDELEAVKAAWIIAREMIDDAEEAVRNILAYVSDPTQSYHIVQDINFKVRWATYFSLFGGFEFGSKYDRRKHELMAARAREVHETFRNLNNNLKRADTAEDAAGALHIEIRCSDDWLKLTDLHGRTHEDGYYWDHRETREDPEADGWFNFGKDPATCDNSPGMKGFTLANVWQSNVDVITLCQTWFRKDWTRDFLNGQGIPTECRGGKAASNGQTIDDFIGDSLAKAIVHELTHTINGANKPNARGDGSIIVDAPIPNEGGKEAYGFSGCWKLSEYPVLAVINADSYAYFAAAVYCSGNLWATGYPQPLDRVNPPGQG